jgi:hypothetical protein
VKNAHLLLLSSCLACVGTETGNPPVIDFGNSGCHDATVNKGIDPQSSVPVADPRFAGLTCMIWDKPAEERLNVRMTNYVAGCHADDGWHPRTKLHDDGRLDLVLQDEDCSIASCGACLYDVAFSIELAETDMDREVRLLQSGCPENTPHVSEASLALSSAAQGYACEYTPVGALLWRSGVTQPAQEHMPCGVNGAGTQSVTCDAGLVCTVVGAYGTGEDRRCLRSCQTDADCDAVDRCIDAVCKLGATGLTSR